MNSNTNYTIWPGMLLIIVLLNGCGGSSNSNDTDTLISNTYSTTSTRGDYSEWTLTGIQLAATWSVINELGTVDYTFTIAATCSASVADSSRNCTIDTASCADGEAVCSGSPSGSFVMMDVPGVALFVITESGSVDEQLHVGFIKSNNACSDDVSGDYTYIRTGLGEKDSFGMFRSDTNFIDVLHLDFGFETTDDNSSQSLAYTTGTESETFTDGGCSDGLRVRNNAGLTIRSMMTASGLFVLDLPAGEGGIISFDVRNAASVSDFANKSFAGISFPDNSTYELLTASSGPVTADKVSISTTIGTSASTINIMGLATADSMTAPAYPSFSSAPPGYDSSVLSADYSAANDIPGLFKFDQLSDSGRVVMAAMKFNDKVIGVGMVYNFRDTTDIDPGAGDGVTTFSGDGLYNTGNFILFER